MNNSNGNQYGYNEYNGYAPQYMPGDANVNAMQYEPDNANGYAGQGMQSTIVDNVMGTAPDKSFPKPCHPPIPCIDRLCHFCGFVWRKTPCCGKCCCCKVWQCGSLYFFQCSDCGKVFWADCEKDCWGN